MTIADQVATQNILMKAIDRLKQFYAKKLFLMQRTMDTQAPPEGFKAYKKNGGGAGFEGTRDDGVDELNRPFNELRVGQEGCADFVPGILDCQQCRLRTSLRHPASACE